MKKKVIAAGHICLDITPVFPPKREESLTDIMTPGRLIHMKGVDVHTGGSVANTGLAMKLLGADVSLMGKIGKDPFGDMVCNILRKYHADDGMLISEEESTSYSVVLAIPGIDRIFLHNPGANDSFCSEDVPQKALEEAALLHFGYPPIMKKMFQNDGRELVELMKRAKACGTATSLDFASIDPDSEAGEADWRKILEDVIPYVDFLVPSVEELCYMLDRERFARWKERTGNRDVTELLDVERDIKPLAEQCMKLGAKVLLIKCGAAGMYYRTADRYVLEGIGQKAGIDLERWADKSGFERSFVPDRVVSGTGAGDTSIAAFLTAMLEGYDLEESVQLAAATGACCVAAYDALSGLKPFGELKERIGRGWAKNSESYWEK
ncbi:MAG: carbohydrate kinase family protein [Lachnospiraceae bacterium]|nr:carbohydrate kinase family protein [Lachnospiraceae bacterium]